MSAAVPNQSFPWALAKSFRYGGAVRLDGFRFGELGNETADLKNARAMATAARGNVCIFYSSRVFSDLINRTFNQLCFQLIECRTPDNILNGKLGKLSSNIKAQSPSQTEREEE
jgi:hypothetical protein